jgi:hypothetical protein
MAASERIVYLPHVMHQHFKIPFVCRIAAHIAAAPSMEPLDG